MRNAIAVLMGVLAMLIASARPAGPLASTARADDLTVLEFETMAAVSGAFVGSSNPIRGVNGGGLPWVISRGEGQLDADGRLEVQVEGLVLAPSAPPSLRGTNPVPAFKAIVSCLASDGSTVNVSTGTFPASQAGNSEIEATVQPPTPCFAPIIFVTSAGGNWFAVTGR